ncbi:hypothetical protein ACJMK2_035604 [Sinanodonta woodiana]|uniref:Uncharacterized protein n=1 Tax=Sinanodonta woodiana TaxID=1069815 RepID=A0ABD3WZD5_SINWO
MVVDLRVHWLPLYISDDIIKEVLGPFGKILDITRDKTMLDKDVVTFNGTQLVKLQTTKFDSRNILHVVSLGQYCPEKTASYASVTTHRRHQAPQNSAPVLVSPSTSASQVVVEPQNALVPQATQTELSIPTNSPELTKEEILIITEDPEINESSAKEGSEKRTKLFDVETLAWTKVSRNKKLKSLTTEDDIDTSVAKV